MPRFFVDDPPVGEVTLAGEAGAHLVRSLRMRPGEEVTLCAGAGEDYRCVILSTDADSARLQVLEVLPSRGEPRVRVTVCPSWPKGDKLDLVTQKAVELGAWALWPVESARCVSRPEGKAVEKKRSRLQKIALEAAQQSGRGRVPRVLEPAPLRHALETAAREGAILFCYERGTASLRQALAAAGDRPLFLFVGPEGGYAPEEAELARSLGAELLTLGSRILRAETAPLAALAAICYEKGEF